MLSSASGSTLDNKRFHWNNWMSIINHYSSWTKLWRQENVAYLESAKVNYDRKRKCKECIYWPQKIDWAGEFSIEELSAQKRQNAVGGSRNQIQPRKSRYFAVPLVNVSCTVSLCLRYVKYLVLNMVVWARYNSNLSLRLRLDKQNVRNKPCSCQCCCTRSWLLQNRRQRRLK